MPYIAEKLETIFDSRTKIYFQETINCYNAKAYRSAVVSLWSVIIYDILSKLEFMEDKFNDNTAKAILKKIRDEIAKDPENPTWEKTLIFEVVNKTRLIDNIEKININQIQQQRHLSAHPTLSATGLNLYSPSEEKCKALILDGINIILSKTPTYTKVMTAEIVVGLATTFKDDPSPDIDLVKSFLKKYPSTTEIDILIFRDLWKFVFRLENDDCNKNRLVNYKALQCYFNSSKSEILQNIKNDKDYYSQTMADSGLPCGFLNHFLASNAEGKLIFDHLHEYAKVRITQFMNTNQNYKLLGWFIRPTIQEHFDNIPPLPGGNIEVEYKVIEQLHGVAKSNSYTLNKFISYCITAYTSSGSFDTADARFKSFIAPIISSLNAAQLSELFQKITVNSQCNSRARSASDHALIIEHAKQIMGDDFDFSVFKL